MKCKKNTYDRNFYSNLYNLLNQFKNKAQVARTLKLSRQALNYHIRKLENQHVQKDNKKSVKKIPKVTSTHLKKVRGHGFQIKLLLPSIKNWNRRTEYMDKNNIPYTDLGGFQRIYQSKYKVWLCTSSIIYYLDKTSFFGKHAEEAYTHMYHFTLDLIRATERRFKTTFSTGKHYRLKVRRNHYALVNDLLARHYRKDRKQQLFVYGNDGVLRLITDFSFGKDETETQHLTTAKPDNIIVQRFMNRLMDGEIEDWEQRVERVLRDLMDATELNSRFIKKIQERIR